MSNAVDRSHRSRPARTHRSNLGGAVLAAAFASACGHAPAGPMDTMSITDGTADVASDSPLDRAPTDVIDSGAPPMDSVTPPTDTGTPPIDTGTPPTDAGTPPTDTGTPPIDTGTPPSDGGVIMAPQPLSANIVVDQFGYRTMSEKIAVIRSPRMGFDSASTFAPGGMYALVDAHTGTTVFRAAPAAWNGGAVDPSSGDVAWWFDFSSVTAVGDYFVLDTVRNVRSDVFRIADDVYRIVLAQAVRMLFYQRDGFAKDARFAGAGWADTAAHMGATQDPHCRLYSDPSNVATDRDVHGGWFDAGDQNRYTNWTATYVIQLLRAFTENPTAFRDDYNIPESGNGTPDVLDETRFGLDWLLRMQDARTGAVLSIAGHAGATQSPPSVDTSPCLYGPASTSATLSSAAAFAFGAVVFAPIDAAYATQLRTAAVNAWNWAQANAAVTFQNSGRVGAGEQEIDAYGRTMRRLEAALYLFEATGDVMYRNSFDQNYRTAHMFAYGNYADMFEGETQETLLGYTVANNATAAVVQAIRTAYGMGMQAAHNTPAQTANRDPYLAYVYTYVWGSNATVATQGTMFTDVGTYRIDATMTAAAQRYAERYVHYFHGVNPLQLVYLSNMSAYGAVRSVTRFYHSWFEHGSARWDAVGVSTYGPPPGYLTGGPNPSYARDGCCPSACGSAANNALCGTANLSPPAGQPDQKAYLDFNDGWPVDSWSVTEPSDGYQVAYIRLLSKFVM